MLTLVGVALICISVLGFGISYVSFLKTERESLDSIIKLAKRIENRIECFKQPLCDIYVGFSCPQLEDMGFISDLKESGLSFSLAKHKTGLMLRDEIFNLTEDFANQLGKSYTEEQLKLCSDFIKKAQAFSDELSSEFEKKSKLSLTLSAAAAAVSAIMLL